jgi:hypothetical protein
VITGSGAIARNAAAVDASRVSISGLAILAASSAIYCLLSAHLRRRYSIHWRLGKRLAREAYDTIAERPSVDVLVNNLGICEAVGFFGLTSGIATRLSQRTRSEQFATKIPTL